MKKRPCEPQIGADIEVFLYDNVKDRVIPCVGHIDGTKDKPFEPKGYKKGFALQEDNVMLEYNIPPAKTDNTWVNRFDRARDMITEHLPEDCSYVIKSEHKFMPSELTSPQAQVIGCEPDFSAYDGGEIRAFAGVLGQERSCGGHIHLGGDFNCPDFVAALFSDLFLGVLGGTRPQRANSRTEWYGMPGIFRPKPYGIEYRTPDNTWTSHNDTIHNVGYYALMLARFLTQTEAAIIRKAFLSINWTRVRDYMTPGAVDRHDCYRDIQTEAMAAGVLA